MVGMGTTVSCPYTTEADEGMPEIKKAGGISRSLDAILYRNSIIENKHSVEMTGSAAHRACPLYKPGPERLLLSLQDHNHPVRYRNILLRELK